MKPNMCKITIVMLFILVMQKVEAQESAIGKMEYGYDAAGNRINRFLTVQFFGNQSLDTLNTSIPIDTLILEAGNQNDHSISNEPLIPELQPAVYPNPVNDNLSIELLYNINKLKISASQIYIYDSKNALISKRTTFFNKEEISLSGLSAGTYYVVIESEENRYIFNIIKN